MRTATLSAIVCLTAAFMAAGCARAAEPAPLSQLIVKFRPASIACESAGIAAFARQTRLDLQWVRPMSGDACVLRLRAADPAKALAALQARPEVEWAESDAVMRPNPR
jgi:hypothetical protein